MRKNVLKKSVSKLPNEKTHVYLYDKIKKCILTNEFEPGAWMQEEFLAARFKVSRTPVREVLRQLQTEGLLEVIPRKGSFVVKLTFKKMMEIYDVCETLEDLAIGCVVDRSSNEKIDQLRNCLLVQEKGKKLGLSNLYLRVCKFHQMLANASENETLAKIMLQTYDKLDMYRLKILSIPSRRTNSIEEHIGVIEAIKERNIRLARRRNRNHIRRVKFDIQKNMHLFD